jgi:phosphoglycolate phosphatase
MGRSTLRLWESPGGRLWKPPLRTPFGSRDRLVDTLVLFDIDGTLVWGGPAKDAFTEAMQETFGTTGDVARVSFAGKTDPQIARELLESVGMPTHEIAAGLPDLFRRYLGGLEARLPERPMEELPGVTELLEALSASGRAALSLVTGNIIGGARLKLGSAGLAHRFPLDGEIVGGFGSDSEERDDLPHIAMRRAHEIWGRQYDPQRVVIVGDTPRDIFCGQAAGTRTLGVATGHFEEAVLAEAGADVVVQDFTDTQKIVDSILA